MNEIIWSLAGVLAGGIAVYIVMHIRGDFREMHRRMDEIERVQKHQPRRIPDNLNIGLDQVLAVAIDKYLVEKADLERSETLIAMLHKVREGKSMKNEPAGQRPEGWE